MKIMEMPQSEGYTIYTWGDVTKAHRLKMKYHHFTCPYCDCVFDADKDHYEYHSNRYDEEWYTTICPCCKNEFSSQDYAVVAQIGRAADL